MQATVQLFDDVSLSLESGMPVLSCSPDRGRCARRRAGV